MIQDEPESQSLFSDDTDNCKIILHLFRSYNSTKNRREAVFCNDVEPTSLFSMISEPIG